MIDMWEKAKPKVFTQEHRMSLKSLEFDHEIGNEDIGGKKEKKSTFFVTKLALFML